jgi:hypothetical protein
MTTIEDIKTELREIIELERQITPGRWSPGSESIWSHNSRVCNDAETDDMIFVCRARNLTPKMAKALLGAVEMLEHMTTYTTKAGTVASNALETIRREWEAQA